MKHVVTVATDFLKILFVSSGTLFSKCGNVRRAVTSTSLHTSGGYNYGSTANRLPLDYHSTAIRPRYDHSMTTYVTTVVVGCCTAAEININ